MQSQEQRTSGAEARIHAAFSGTDEAVPFLGLFADQTAGS